eukprot:3107164-Amphidinium_carterae.1
MATAEAGRHKFSNQVGTSVFPEEAHQGCGLFIACCFSEGRLQHQNHPGRREGEKVDNGSTRPKPTQDRGSQSAGPGRNTLLH